jgi:hypothetical protein
MLGSQHPLLAKLAVDIAAAQDKRGSQTVGNRFREQLQDLITRLDECVLHPHWRQQQQQPCFCAHAAQQICLCQAGLLMCSVIA